jgi:Fe-S-cluster-containing hydrogenase component 2
MPYRITNACIGCGNCSVACPLQAVKESGRPLRAVGNNDTASDESGNGRFMGWDAPFYYIDCNCNQCGSCYEVCPAGAVVWQDN